MTCSVATTSPRFASAELKNGSDIHALYQTLTRAVPAAQNANLFNWLKTLYQIGRAHV